MSNTNFTCHSETGKIKSLFIKNVQQAFISDAHIEKHWAALNYLSKPDLNNAIAEYENFETILKQQGIQLFYLPQDASVNMDAIYCRDASIATNHGMIICNMAKQQEGTNLPQKKKRIRKMVSLYSAASLHPAQLRAAM